jgi:hypothetical protein
MTFIDVIVGSALVLIMFGGIIAAFRYGIELIATTRGEQGALSIAGGQLESIRALPYSAVGTVLGIPSGTIPQEETILLNGVTYTKRILIQYVDAPEDGLDEADENGITADYKRARVSVSWTSRGKSHEKVLLTTIVPQGIETTVGGGTIRITVFNSLVQPVSGASVRVVNTSTVPQIDVTTFTNAQGIVLFSGAPAASSYAITVTKNGYSSDQTYSATTGNPNPNPGHISVLETQTSSISFAIDVLSTTKVRTLEPITSATTTDAFLDMTLIAESAGVVVLGGAVTLAPEEIGYVNTGTLYSTAVTGSPIAKWTALSWHDALPANTQIRYHLYYNDSLSMRQIVPDGALSGNSMGFTVSPVSLATVAPALYPNLIVRAVLTTSDPLVTPSLDDWSLAYDTGPTSIPNIPFSLHGEKVIGTDAAAQPLYKYDAALTTDGTGEKTISALEWDTYLLSVDGVATGRDIAESCPAQPFVLNPGVSTVTDITLVPHTTHSLRVVVTDSANTPLTSASVRLSRTGYDTTETSSSCGQVFFPGLVSAEDYVIDTTHPGYVDDSQTISVDGTGAMTIMLNPTP